MDLPNYHPTEERLNYITHGIGFVAAIIGLGFLVWGFWQQKDTLVLIGVTIFGITAAITLLTSTIYHWLEHIEAKKAFRLLDHASIYLLIAGSYTPFALGNLRNVCGQSMLITVWSLAVIGIIFKFAIRHHLDRLVLIDSSLYVVFGLVSMLFIKYIIGYLPTGALVLLSTGGALYLIGTLFYVSKSIKYNHAIWHLFVMAAVSCHYAAVLLYASSPAQ